MSRYRYGVVERGRATNATLLEMHRIAAVLGLELPVRLYPSGPPLRDAAHAKRLHSLLDAVALPLTYRIEVPLPTSADRTDLRAWDAMLLGHGRRTACELEMRLRDAQALARRIALKRRDDPPEGFLLLVADTRNNRRVIAEYADLFADLPRLKPSVVRAALAAGQHPPSGLLLI